MRVERISLFCVKLSEDKRQGFHGQCKREMGGNNSDCRPEIFSHASQVFACEQKGKKKKKS